MHLFRWLLLLFLIVPLIEIYLLIEIGGRLGAAVTVFLVVFTAVLGALLVRLQGFSTLVRVRATLAQGEVPAAEMLEGAVLLLSGALLLTPGFFTDALGFLCLVPALRRRLVLWLLERSLIAGTSNPNRVRRPAGPRTIEGEFWRERDD